MGSPDSDSEEVTLFLGNLRNKLQRDDIMALMDSMQLEPFYNFVYVPLCMDTGMNKGYGFVNFTKVEAADKFIDVVSHQQSQQCPLYALTVTNSKTQGLEANLARWRRPRYLRIRNSAAMPFVKGKLDLDTISIEHNQHGQSQVLVASRQGLTKNGEQCGKFRVEHVRGHVPNQKMQERFGSSVDVRACSGRAYSQDLTGRMDGIDELMFLKSLAKRPVLERTSIERQPGARTGLMPYIQGEPGGSLSPQMAPCVTQKLRCSDVASDKDGCTNEASWSVSIGEELSLGFVPTEDTVPSVAPTVNSFPSWHTTTVDSLPQACSVGLAVEQSPAPAAGYPGAKSGAALVGVFSF